MKSQMAAVTCCVFFIGCATTKKGDLDALKPTLDAFHSRMRWKDFQSVAALLSPDKRQAFLAASSARDDAKNLNVSDYELAQ